MAALPPVPPSMACMGRLQCRFRFCATINDNDMTSYRFCFCAAINGASFSF
jgi:hypothetical protein